MTDTEAKQIIQSTLNITEDNGGLLILKSIKKILETINDDDINIEQGIQIIQVASCHMLTDDQLLEFFNTTLQAVTDETGEDFIQEHGLYKALVTSPHLSPVCRLFFGAWIAVYYRDNPLRCRIRRIGLDAYKMVAVLPDDKEMQYSETLTAKEMMEYSNCPVEALRDMPILN